MCYSIYGEKQFSLFLIPSRLHITKGVPSFLGWQQVKESFPWRWKEKSSRLDPKLSSEPIIDISRPKKTRRNLIHKKYNTDASTRSGGKRRKKSWGRNLSKKKKILHPKNLSRQKRKDWLALKSHILEEFWDPWGA